MSQDTIIKTVYQYSRDPVSETDMGKLLEIAADYCRVKNYVYRRYGGIGSLGKLYPGYTVQNEMTRSGLREELGMPSVYFYLAVFDALGDIKCQWTVVKSEILKRIARNGELSPEEKHYLRFLLKVDKGFQAVVNQRKPEGLPEGIREQMEALAGQVDAGKLHRYLCRQVRKCLRKLHTDRATGFAAAERAYRYGDHGIYLSTKEKRKRVFIPLTDNSRYEGQIYVKLYPEEERLEIKVPVGVAVRVHEDYGGEVGLAVGMSTMLTTDKGHCYGRELGKYQEEYASWVREQTRKHNCSGDQNPGRKKYNAKKRRYEEQLHSYMNYELNLFLKTERPGTVYMAKLPGPGTGGPSKRINHLVSMWQRGYLRSRLIQKCRENSVEVVEVFGKDIGRECSSCGAAGDRKEGVFTCPFCGYSGAEKENTARNALKRGQEGKTAR